MMAALYRVMGSSSVSALGAGHSTGRTGGCAASISTWVSGKDCERLGARIPSRRSNPPPLRDADR